MFNSNIFAFIFLDNLTKRNKKNREKLNHDYYYNLLNYIKLCCIQIPFNG